MLGARRMLVTRIRSLDAWLAGVSAFSKSDRPDARRPDDASGDIWIARVGRVIAAADELCHRRLIRAP